MGPLLFGLSLQEWADYGQIASGVGAIAATIGVFAVFRQVRFQAQELEQQAADERLRLITVMTGLMTAPNRALIEYPGMRRYFYENRSPRLPRTRDRARSIAITLGDAMDNIAGNLHLMDEPAAREAWRIYFKNVHANSPPLRELLLDHPDWYPRLCAIVIGTDGASASVESTPGASVRS